MLLLPQGPTRITATAGTARFSVFAGRPLHQTTVPGGPFIGSTTGQTSAFCAAFCAGNLTTLLPFDQAALDRLFDQRAAIPINACTNRSIVIMTDQGLFRARAVLLGLSGQSTSSRTCCRARRSGTWAA